MTIGVVRQSESELIKDFKITKFPTLMVVTNDFEYSGDVYTGEAFAMEALKDFFRPYAYGEKKQVKPKSFLELSPSSQKAGLCDKGQN